MRRFCLGVAYGIPVGIALAVLFDVGDWVVGYVKPTLGRLNP